MIADLIFVILAFVVCWLALLSGKNLLLGWIETNDEILLLGVKQFLASLLVMFFIYLCFGLIDQPMTISLKIFFWLTISSAFVGGLWAYFRHKN